jgi:hypothetical protein
VRGSGRTLVLAGALALSTIAVVPSGVAGASGCVVPGEQRTIEVRLKVLQKTVNRGKSVPIEIRTYRPAQTDFLGTGVDLPPGLPMEPVGNVNITLAVLTANEYVSQAIATRTDAEGKRLVKFKVATYQRKGPAIVRARALVDHFSEQPVGTCVELQEGGYTEVRNALTVR